MLHFTDSVRDPIHGLIPLTACERDLLRTRPLSRLRGVRQMGMAYVIYPGAHHTRFEHVIGAMHTAWQIAEDLPIFGYQEMRLLRLAVLCHDLGHRPFSHSLEDAAKRYAHKPGLGFLADYLDHEEHTRHLLLHDPEIGEVLARHPDYRHIDRAELAALATGEHPRRDLNLLVHSEIDADRIDYVMRDNYYCGFAHGIDVQSLKHLYALDETHGLVLSESHVYLASQLLAARYHLINNIQNNPSSRLGDLLLAAAIKDALQGADAAVQERFAVIANSGQDADMEHFLRERAGDAWHKLRAMVSGETPYALVESVDFPLLSPTARYALQSLQQRGGSVGLALQEHVQEALGSPVLVDVARVSPPVEPVPTQRAGHLPWHPRLTDHPMVTGIVTASLQGAAVQVYAPPGDAPDMDQATFETWVSRYKAIDPTLTPEKASLFLHEFWHGDRAHYGLVLALETLLLDQLLDRFAAAPSRLDALFVTLYAVLTQLEAALDEPRLYIDGREAVRSLLSNPEIQKVWARGPLGPYLGREQQGFLRNDLHYLRLAGLLYATPRLERVKNVFVERSKYGATGWGRRLSAKLAAVPEFAEKLAQLQAAANRIFDAESIASYEGYFALLGAEDAASAAKRRELRKRMPVALSR